MPRGKNYTSAFNQQQQRDSQESRATSTPKNQNSPVLSISTSISSIALESKPQEADVESRPEVTEMEVDSSRETSTQTSIPSQPGVRRVRRMRTIKFEGFYACLKPTNKNSLYYKIMTKPRELDSLTDDLVEQYKTNKEKVFLSIIQLIVDLAGYANLDMESVYDFENPNRKHVIKIMENGKIVEGKFLFMKYTKFSKNAEDIISDFLNELLFAFFKNKMLDRLFDAHVTSFIAAMSRSFTVPIRTTAVVLVIKLLAIFIELWNQLNNLRNNDSFDSNQWNVMNEIEVFFRDQLDVLYLIVDQNCLIEDKAWAPVKVRITEEMFDWITVQPEIFLLQSSCFSRLTKMLLDMQENVRLAALTTLEKLIECETISRELRQKIEDCFIAVSGRFKDVSSKVVVKAINVFMEAIERYSEFITREYEKRFIEMIFYEEVALYKASAKFLMTYFRHLNKSEKQFLLKVNDIAIEVCSKKDKPYLLSYFLESCFEFAYELENWTLINDLLFEEQDDLRRCFLLKIYYECVKHKLTGVFSSPRSLTPVKPEITHSDHESFVKSFIPKFTNLLITFERDKDSLELLVEMLSFIDYDVCHPNLSRDHWPEILAVLKEMFIKSASKGLLEKIAKVFFICCDKRHYSNHIKKGIERIKDSIKMSQDLKNLNETPLSERTLVHIREKSLKAALLFEKYDLTSIFEWEDIFQIRNPKFLQVVKYLIVCCKWHLIWRLRQVLRNDNEFVRRHVLEENCKAFIYGCLDMLKNGYTGSESYMILESFCDLHDKFDDELTERPVHNTFYTQITDAAKIKIFIDFVVEHVIKNRAVDLIQRQKALCYVMDGILSLDVIQLQHFAPIFRYYESHYEEFGKIMEKNIGILHQIPPTLPLLVMHTLREVYDELMEKNHVVDIRSDEAKFLKKLAKKFASVNEFQKSKNVTKLVQMCIGFASRSQRHLTFLYFTRYFLKSLDAGGKKDVCAMFRKQISKEEASHPAIKQFADALK